MKIVGLIAEYNPFHNGHHYHIQQALKLTGADHAVVVMSGNFVQRGAPAIMSKYLRAHCALYAGAAAVIELPVYYSCASAEYFAQGAVSLLHQLGCIDSLCFGSECGDLYALERAADILYSEPAAYRAALLENLKKGFSYPAARQRAYSAFSVSQDPELLSKPNNILGIEYLKALRRHKSNIKAYTLPRTGATYHDPMLRTGYSSATALRTHLNNGETLDPLRNQMPAECFHLLQEAYCRQFPVTADDFSLLLKIRLLDETPNSLTSYADLNGDLANRIIKKRNQFLSFGQFCELLKTRELTYSRISRSLIHVLLRLTREQMSQFQRDGEHFYARLLGYNHLHSGVLSLLKKHSNIPLVTRPSQVNCLPAAAQSMFEADRRAADLYESVITDKFHTPFQNELTRSFIKV